MLVIVASSTIEYSAPLAANPDKEGPLSSLSWLLSKEDNGAADGGDPIGFACNWSKRESFLSTNMRLYMRNNDKAVVLPMAEWVRMPPCLGRDLEDVAMLAGVAERQSEPVGV